MKNKTRATPTIPSVPFNGNAANDGYGHLGPFNGSGDNSSHGLMAMTALTYGLPWEDLEYGTGSTNGVYDVGGEVEMPPAAPSSVPKAPWDPGPSVPHKSWDKELDRDV